MRTILQCALFVCAGWSTLACEPAVAVSQAVAVESVATAWTPVVAPTDPSGLAAKTKVVPAIWLRVKNVSAERLVSLQVNAVFRRAGQDGEWGSAFATVAGTRGLEPGARTDEVALASTLGYTGSDPAHELLENSEFVDASVDIFVKYASAQWTRVAQVPIARRLVWNTEKHD